MEGDPPESELGRKIQTPGGSYQITLPQEFGRWAESNGVERVTTAEAGDKVIVRPVGATGTDPEQSVDIPEDLPAEDSEFIYSFLTNVVQSYCVAGADFVDISFPSSFDERERTAFEQTFRDIEIDELLEWNRSEKGFEVGSLDFETYVDKVFRFVNDYLVHPLFVDSFPELRHDEIHRNEEKIDRYWALVTRELGRRFLELERDRFPEGLCGVYLGKYLEMIADLVKRLAQLCYEFTERYGDHPDLVDGVRSELQAAFCGTSISAGPFDEQLRDVAERSYALDVELEDLQHQYNVLDARSGPLESLVDLPRRFVERDSDEFDAADAYECGLLLGEIQHVARTLVEFPRSMAFTGLGAKNVDSIHGVRTAE